MNYKKLLRETFKDWDPEKSLGSQSKFELEDQTLFIGISGPKHFHWTELINAGLDLIRNEGYEIGNFDPVDDDPGYVAGNLDVDTDLYRAYFHGTADLNFHNPKTDIRVEVSHP
jgi:hypothetical protein